jgi:hypothetical protein
MTVWHCELPEWLGFHYIFGHANTSYSCALLDIHRPDLIDFDQLDKKDHKGNTALAFKLANEEIGIPSLLDVEDVCDVPKPDERSLMTYIAYWFHAFSHLDRIETAGRRVEKFVEVMQSAWDMQHNFEKRMTEVGTRRLLQDLDSNVHVAFEANQRDTETMGGGDLCRHLYRCEAAVDAVRCV